MNRASPNTNNNNSMLHCLNTSGNLSGNCSDMTVLERQRATMKLQQQQQQHQHHLQQQQQQTYFSATGFNGLFSPDLQLQNSQGLMMMGGGGNSALAEVVANAHSMKPDPGLDNGWPDLGFGSSGLVTAAHATGFDINSAILRTSSCPPSVVAGAAVSEVKGRRELAPASEKLSSASGRESFKKRKADKVQNTKVVAENANKDKRIKISAEEGESKITEQNSTKNTAATTNNNNNKAATTNNNNNKATSPENPKENSKASEVQKPDYIHVRARRGQATDSHSLAERVRREKISERMKYLQDLVPGCNKITGKAGMLDEIINYVQSLQRQVEFLSMKLAAVNPRLDFNNDDLFSKEVFPPCAPSFPTIGMSTEMTNQAYLQFNSAQQIVSCSGLDMGVNYSDAGLRRSISAPVSMPEMFLDSSCYTQMLPYTAWETDLQNLYNVGFDHQARSTSFPTQPFTGAVEVSNLKMEM